MSLRFAFPISKFEKQADGSLKIVGLATDETLDSQGDILDYEGSKAAFASWRGNVREAHDPKKPVGKKLNVEFNDDAKAINVEAFISAGAPDTIKKIEDGVLQSFSVGGPAPTKVKMEKVGDKMARRVLEWQMSELSVVDVGANPNANITLVKADGTATDVLAVEAREEIAAAANRFADALLKAVKPADPPPAAEQPPPAPEPPPTAKADEQPAEEEEHDEEHEEGMCDKCNKVHKEGIEACNKEDLAAANTARAKKEIEAAKAKHKIAQAKEELLAAKTKLEEVKGGGQEKTAAVAPEKVAKFKKAFEEWDIRAALEILEGLKALLFNETQEAETEPPAERKALEDAIANVKAFVASEAAELAATQADGSAPVAAATAPVLMKDIEAAFDQRFAKFEEAITKTKSAGDVPADLFTTNHGDQMAEGIGKGLSVVTERIAAQSAALVSVKTEISEIAKAQAELKGLTTELKGVRESIEKLSKTAAVPVPLRTVPPREDFTAPGRNDNGIAALERALASTTHPETMALLNQQIAIAKAMQG